MRRSSLILVMVAMLGALGGLAYVQASRTHSDDRGDTKPSAAFPVASDTGRNAAETPAIAADSDVSQSAATPVEPASSAPQLVTDDVERWIADTQSNDAKTRGAAIAALAHAPKTQAMPALERVLESGEPQVDRQIALRSLHALALHDGDRDGAIRDVIRRAMYHSEDDGVTQSAQAVLEDIEAGLAESNPTTSSN